MEATCVVASAIVGGSGKFFGGDGRVITMGGFKLGDACKIKGIWKKARDLYKVKHIASVVNDMVILSGAGPDALNA